MCYLLLTDIKTNGTQTRAEINDAVVEEYAEFLEEGGEFPPVIVFEDYQGVMWLSDGFHRLEAYRKQKKQKIPATIQQGTKDDAIFFGASANAEHGLRRTNADKRHAVEMLLSNPLWSDRSDNWIADVAKVSNHLVSSVRSTWNSPSSNHSEVAETTDTETEQVSQTPGTSSSESVKLPSSNKTKRTGKDGKKRPAGNPNKRDLLCDSCKRANRVGQDVPEKCIECDNIKRGNSASETLSIFCQSCQQNGAKSGCPECAKLRKPKTTPSKNGEVVFDWREFDKHFGSIVRMIDGLYVRFDRTNKDGSVKPDVHHKRLRELLGGIRPEIEQAIEGFRK